MIKFYALFVIRILLASPTLAHTHCASSEPLQWDVYLNPPVPVNNPSGNLSWPPTAFTLIYGPRTAVIVDAPITIASSNALADWIETKIPGRRLTHNYITHGHGDHLFGSAILQQRFPGLKIVVTDRTLAHIQQQLSPSDMNGLWLPLFPSGQIANQNETFTTLPANKSFSIDGHVLRAIEVGQSDTYNTTVLHVPDLDMVVTGDVVWGQCYLFFGESTTHNLRHQWLKAIDEVESLNPKIVVAGHKQSFDGFGSDHFQKTREYIRTWERLLKCTRNATDLIDRVKRAYPERIGDFILQTSANAAFPAA
ncbi:beta-lactamase-like protein [Xylogone sp. PMI_703]|nr:beta-lactamase-like protein [Xylogone sp. PMI_703]